MGKTVRLNAGLSIFLSLAVSLTQANDGRLFLLTFMNISTGDITRLGFQQISFTSSEDANFRAVIPGADMIVYGSLNATNNRQYELTITKDLATPKESEISKVGILVSSDKPITVQASKAQAGSTDGYTAIPLTQGATEFFVPSWENITIVSAVSHSIFGIVSLFDGTCTEVYRIRPDGTYVRLWFLGLEALDVFQALSSTEDYSGIYINSTKPIAVMGGHECAQVPDGFDYCDHLIDAVPPVVDWGTDYIVGPIDGRSMAAGYFIRVYSATDGTAVTFTASDVGRGGGTFTENSLATFTTTVDKGQFHQTRTSNSMVAVIVTCTNPCMVVQYNPSMKAGGAGETVNTDAYMTIIPPLDRFKNEYSFGTSKYFYEPSTNDYHAVVPVNYVTVIAKTADISTITLDGTSMSFNAIPEKPDYSVATSAIAGGFHVVKSTSPTAEMAVFVYGHGELDHTGYGFVAGHKRQEDEIQGNFYNITALKLLGGSSLTGGGTGNPGEPELTTAAPVPTDATDWLSLVSDDEYPIYMVELEAEFFNVDRAGSLIERKCTEAMLDQLRDTRMPAMENELNTNLLPRYCENTDIKATLSEGTLYTKYSKGALKVTIDFTGTKTMTFRSLKACADKIRPHLSDLKNWPSPDKYFLHIVRPNTVTADCDPVYFDPTFKETLIGWKCDRREGVVAAAASWTKNSFLILAVMTILNIFHQSL